MITLIELTEFLGWVSVLNIGFLLVTTILLLALKKSVVAIHSRMLGIPEAELPALYFTYLANYKTLSLVFCIGPYLALKIMTS